jgi:hypothetical protein
MSISRAASPTVGPVSEPGNSRGEGVQALRSQYVVVLRAPSAARFLPEEGWELVLNAPNLDLEGIRVRTFTRWVNEAGKEIPRELVVEVRGYAGSLDEATAKFGAVARPIATVVGFVANVRVGSLEVHLAYDCTPSSDHREFLEVFVADERGRVSEGRIIRRHLMGAACISLVTLGTDTGRIGRALRQYELALRQWYVGGEWLALSHLWIAVENLTEAVVRKTLLDRSCSEKELATSLGVVTDDPEHPRWPQIMREQVREQLIFRGDHDTYKTAKSASEGLEHGFMELDKVAAHALKSTARTFLHVRQTIVDLLALPTGVAQELMEIKPKDVESMRKVARGRLIGVAEDPAMEGELYPRLEWSSSIDSIVREGTSFQMKQKDVMTIRTHPNVGFRLEGLEVRGRLQDGEAPVQLTHEDVMIEHTQAGPAQHLLGAVMPLVHAAVASGADKGHTLASMFAFNMFGQATAFFQSIQVLIAARHPVEALPALRGLVILAARFEQMTEPTGPGLGLPVRCVLDALGDHDGDPHLIRARRQEISTAAVLQGFAIPESTPAPESTSIYKSLGGEMTLATAAVNGSYATTSLHQQKTDAQHFEFVVALEPGPLTDLVATAAVIAHLELLKRAAILFDWTVDVDQVHQLLEDARAANEAAVDSDVPSSLS